MIVDRDVRDRLLGELDSTFFVEAGAGTGKTTVLVGRIVNLVAAGRVDMEHLAAITFTEAAAAELRDRVREGLERAAAQGEGEARERCLRAVEQLDLAAIQTIHAFAGGLLRSYPLEADLPPGFTMLDEIEQGLAFDERFRTWFWGPALESPAREVLRRALLLGLTQDNLRDLARLLDGQHDLLTRETIWDAAPPPDALAVADESGRRLTALAQWIDFAHAPETDPLAETVRRAQPAAERLLAATTAEQALAALRDLEGLKASRGNQKDWGKLPDGRNACAAIKAEIKQAQEQIAAALAGQRQATLAAVLGLLRDFVLDGVSARKRDGVASFQDLLAWARDLLRDRPDVRRRAQRRYARIFVDEFQDTDPLQAEIVFYLAAEPDEPLPADWRDIRPVPGKLFVVGDPKQSIYRFRRADIAVYDGLLRRLAEAQARLVQNFRSVRPLLDWVNHHFDGQRGGPMVAVEGIQPPYVALAARWESFDGDAPCGVFRVGLDLGSEASAALVARTEAKALAETIRATVGSVLVSQRAAGDTRELRPAAYRDVCILLRSRTHLRSLERALEQAAIPYRVESGKLMLATQEVRDLLACLRAIEDPSDQVALVGALRAPAYACSDPDLLRWVEGGGKLSHEAPGDGPAGPVRDALASLADYQARRQTLSPPALIEAFIRERLLVAVAFDEPRPGEAWRRLRYVVQRARAFTATGRHSLRAFLDWIDDLDRAEVRDAESAEAEPDEDAVRLLTVHGAKGLEFPIVLLAGLGSEGGGSSLVVCIPNRQDGRLACRVGPAWQTSDFEAARLREQAMSEAEAVRLLYVAATRARDHLVLSLYRGGKGRETCAAALIEQRLAGAEGLCRALPVVPPTAHGGSGPVCLPIWSVGPDDQGGYVGPSLPDEEAWLRRRAELLDRLAAPRTVETRTVTEPEAEPADLDVLPGTPRGPDLEQSVRRLLRRPNGQESDAADIPPAAIELAGAIRASPAYRRAVASPSCRRDVPLLAAVDGVVVDLDLDLVYEADGDTVLVLYDLDGAAGSSRPDPAVVGRAFELATGRAARRVEIIPGAGTVDGGG